jgi:hypothetical protein
MKLTVKQKMQDWINYYESDSNILMSSSPYAYIQNEKFEDIKNLGPEYLPYILKEVEQNQFAVFALWGIKDISKAVNFPKWYSDDECVRTWNQYVERLPEKFNKLKEELYSETDSEKIKLKSKGLKELGYLALPFIVNENNSKMDNIAKQLFRENINQISYSEIKSSNSQSKNVTLEEKVNTKLQNYRELMKANENIKNIDLYKVNIKYN